MKCSFCSSELVFVAPGRNIENGILTDYIEQYICECCNTVYIYNICTNEFESYDNN